MFEGIRVLKRSETQERILKLNNIIPEAKQEIIEVSRDIKRMIEKEYFNKKEKIAGAKNYREELEIVLSNCESELKTLRLKG